jgi:hypothetical protein
MRRLDPKTRDGRTANTSSRNTPSLTKECMEGTRTAVDFYPATTSRGGKESPAPRYAIP